MIDESILTGVLALPDREMLRQALLQRRGSSIFGVLFEAVAAVDTERAAAGSAAESAALLAHIKRTSEGGVYGGNLQLQELLREEYALGVLRGLIASSRKKLERQANARTGGRSAGELERNWTHEFEEVHSQAICRRL